jgi:hypothetical protein
MTTFSIGFHESYLSRGLNHGFPCIHATILVFGDPDPHVFRPPGSGSISQRCGSGSFSFLINVLSGLK